jgi:hypothetical protein
MGAYGAFWPYAGFDPAVGGGFVVEVFIGQNRHGSYLLIGKPYTHNLGTSSIICRLNSYMTVYLFYPTQLEGVVMRRHAGGVGCGAGGRGS